jgi:hypothetical protein
MFLRTLIGGPTIACGVLAAAGLHSPSRDGCPGARFLTLTCASASADDKQDDKPTLSGTWDKKESELKIEFADGSAKFFLHGDNPDRLIAVVCSYTAEKGGPVKAEVTGYEGKEELKKVVREKIPVGLKFSFKWTANGGAAKLDDLMGDEVLEQFKAHLEGDFEKK